MISSNEIPNKFIEILFSSLLSPSKWKVYCLWDIVSPTLRAAAGEEGGAAEEVGGAAAPEGGAAAADGH